MGRIFFHVSAQYILSLMRFLSQNLELYIFNSTISGFNTRNKLQSHTPSTTLTVYWREGCYRSIKIFKKMPDYIVELVLRQMFYIKFEEVFDKAFCSFEEYINSSIFHLI